MSLPRSALAATKRCLRRGLVLAVRPVSRLYRQLLFARGQDRTEELEQGSALIVAPHPDDETLGCAVTIMRKRRRGVDVRIVIASDGSRSHTSAVISREELAAIRRREALDAADVLGVEDANVTFLDLEDGTLGEQADELERLLTQIFHETNPDEVFLPSAEDLHADHRATNRAVRAAIEGSGIAAMAFEYPIWFWSRLPWPGASHDSRLAALRYAVTAPVAQLFRAPSALVRTEGLLSRKREAIAAYRSQLTNLSGEPGWWILEERFIANFLRSHEVFFPLAPIVPVEASSPVLSTTKRGHAAP